MPAKHIRKPGWRPEAFGGLMLVFLGLWCVSLVLSATACNSTKLGQPPFSPGAQKQFLQAVRPPSGETARLLQNASTLRMMGRTTLALKELEEAYQREPGNLKIVDALAQCYEDLGAYERAQDLYQEALKREPGHPALTNNLCFSYYQAGLWQKAEACFREALQREPGNAKARNNLGLLLVRQGRQTEALALWQQHEGEAAARQRLSQAMASLGLPAPAAQARLAEPLPASPAAASPAATTKPVQALPAAAAPQPQPPPTSAPVAASAPVSPERVSHPAPVAAAPPRTATSVTAKPQAAMTQESAPASAPAPTASEPPTAVAGGAPPSPSPRPTPTNAPIVAKPATPPPTASAKPALPEKRPPAAKPAPPVAAAPLPQKVKQPESLTTAVTAGQPAASTRVAAAGKAAPPKKAEPAQVKPAAAVKAVTASAKPAAVRQKAAKPRPSQPATSLTKETPALHPPAPVPGPQESAAAVPAASPGEAYLTSRELLETPLVVLNGNGRRGMALKHRQWLNMEGFTVVAHANFRDFGQKRTAICYHPDMGRVARHLAQHFYPHADLQEVPAPAGKATVKIILGRDQWDREGQINGRLAALAAKAEVVLAALPPAGKRQPPEGAAKPAPPASAGLVSAQPESTSAGGDSRPLALTAAELIQTRIALRNGNGRPKLARDCRTELSLQGFNVVDINNHHDFGAEQTVILHRSGAERVARALAQQFFPTARLQEAANWPEEVDVKVILGKDLTQRPETLAFLAH